MTEERKNRIIDMADYIIKFDATQEECATHFGTIPTDIQYKIHRNLRDIDENKYKIVREIFERHKKEKKKSSVWRMVTINTPKGIYLVKNPEGELVFAYYSGYRFYENHSADDHGFESRYCIPAYKLVPKNLKNF